MRRLGQLPATRHPSLAAEATKGYIGVAMPLVDAQAGRPHDSFHMTLPILW